MTDILALVDKADKDLGKGAIVSLNAGAMVGIPVIQTGIPDLDIALGVGGVPEGRIVEIFGAESSGKCLTGDTYILTSNGYKTVEDIFLECGVNPSCSSKVVKMSYKLINRYGEVEKTKNFTCNNRKKVYLITTRTGVECKSTSNHPHLVFNERGNFVWKKTCDVSVGDFLVQPRYSYFGDNVLSVEEAYGLGLMIADGSLSDGRISITNDDEYIKDFILSEFAGTFKIKDCLVYRNNDKGSYNYHFNDKKRIAELGDIYGIKLVNSKYKEVPECIFNSNRNTIKYFLRGYVDCESYISKGTIELSSASEKLLKQVKLLLSQFGIISSLTKGIVKKYNKYYYGLYIRNNEAKKYLSLIGTESTQKLEQVKHFSEPLHSTFVDSVPNINNVLKDLFESCETDRKVGRIFDGYQNGNTNISYNRLIKIIENVKGKHYLKKYLIELCENKYMFDEVKSNVYFDEVPTFDFEMEKTHSFIANGIITHNTTVCLKIIAMAQAIGKKAGIVDAEHALDPAWAINNGVNLDELALSQPDTGEQGLKHALWMIENGIDVVVVDSVSALVPRAELEGEMGAQHMGLQARLMGQGMRKLVGRVKKKKAIIIFINQIRCLPLETFVVENGELSTIEQVKKNVVLNGERKTRILNKFDSGLVGGLEVRLKQRGVFRLSSNHKQPVIKDGEVKVVTGNELKIGDWFMQPILNDRILCDTKNYIDLRNIVKKTNSKLGCNSKKTVLPKVLNETLAFLLGVYYSDGHLREYEKNCIYGVGFAEKNSDRYELIKKATLELFDKKIVKHNRLNNNNIYLGGKQVMQYFKELGCLRYGKNKVIPELIKRSKSSVIKAFIKGAFFDTHGFNEKGFVFTNENKSSLNDFALILYYFGIFADIRNGDTCLVISGNDAVEFSNVFGFAEKRKQEMALSFKKSRNARGKYDVVPYLYGLKIFNKIKKNKIKGLSYNKHYGNFKACLFSKLNCGRLELIKLLKENEKLFKVELDFLQKNRFTEIITIKKISFKAVDIETEAGYFVADKFLTHNCKIGVMFGSPKTTSGGNALKFAASIRMDIARTGSMKLPGDNGEAYANKVKIKIVKNKVAPPFKICEFIIDFERGLQTVVNLFEYLVNHKEIVKKGSWFYYGDESLGQGRPKAFNTFAEEYDIEAIYQDVLSEINGIEEEVDEDVESKLLELETKFTEVNTKYLKAKEEKKIEKRDKLKKKVNKLKKKIAKLKGEEE